MTREVNSLDRTFNGYTSSTGVRAYPCILSKYCVYLLVCVCVCVFVHHKLCWGVYFCHKQGVHLLWKTVQMFNNVQPYILSSHDGFFGVLRSSVLRTVVTFSFLVLRSYVQRTVYDFILLLTSYVCRESRILFFTEVLCKKDCVQFIIIIDFLCMY
jgi:hypothetical protein